MTQGLRVFFGYVCALALFFSAGGGAWAGERDLRLMSYNIFGMIIVKNDHSRYAKIGKILKERREAGTAPEVVALNEAFHSRTKELWREAGYPYKLRGLMGKGVRIGSGLVILSEYPIEADGTTLFKHCFDVDCFARKGALRVKVHVPGLPWPVSVAVTHMQADYSDRPKAATQLARKARLNQTKQLVKFLAGRDPAAGPQFYMGDFNFQYGAEDYQRFMGKTAGADLAKACLSVPWACAPDPGLSDDWRKLIDHIFVPAGGYVEGAWHVRPLTYGRTFRGINAPETGPQLSDHVAIETTVRISWPDHVDALASNP